MPRYIDYTSPEHRQSIIDNLLPTEVIIGEQNINLDPVTGKPRTNQLIIEDDPEKVAAMRGETEATV